MPDAHAKSRRFNRGFTLVELLVVVAVIAVLIAMILPGIEEARTAAIRVRCGGQLRLLGTGMIHYATDHRGRFQTYFYSSLNLNAPNIVSKTLGDLWINQYAMPMKAMICPTLDSSLSRWGYNTTLPTPGYMLGYCLNIPSLNNLPATCVGAPKTVPSAAKDLQDLSTKTLAADLNVRAGGVWTRAYPWGEVTSHVRRQASPEGANSMFLDGHVRWFTASKLGPAAQGVNTPGNFDYWVTGGTRITYWGVLP